MRLRNFDTGTEYYTASISGMAGNNTEGISGEATTVPAGHYRITICDEHTPNPEVTFKPLCDTSDSYTIPN